MTIRIPFIVSLLCLTLQVGAQQAASPNGRLTLAVTDSSYVLSCQDRQVLEIAATPIGRPLFVRHVEDSYTMLVGKRRHCRNEANEYVVAGKADTLVLRLYNDGLAFRTQQPATTGHGPGGTAAGNAASPHYIIADGTRRWLLKWSDSYEGFFPQTTAATDGRWAYPALAEPVDGLFALITEADITRGHSASSLHSHGCRYSVVPDEQTAGGNAVSPWRVVVVGSLADVVESTLVTDVSTPCRLTDTSWIRPGTVSWIYWAHNHGSNDFHIIKQYVDMAVTLRLPYVLIDAEWDTMKDGKTIEDAVAYACSKGVKPMIWYNSSVGWVDGAPTPKFRLNKAGDREREFAWCRRIGVAGVKVDFFSGDTQACMDYCQDLMESAARHHLLINFHGATTPRGWQRTWPNLLTTEAVYGAEWYNNGPQFTRRAAAHNATLPFTRNVIGSMDYTPCTFSDSQHPHITSHAHELALTVLFESGLQHLADRPESYLSQPRQVQQFLTELPTAWDETRLLGGYPGDHVLMARRSGTTWYVAAINGTDKPKTIALADAESHLQKSSFSWPLKGTATVFLDAVDGTGWDIKTGVHAADLPATITCQPRGGFVIVVASQP